MSRKKKVQNENIDDIPNNFKIQNFYEKKEVQAYMKKSHNPNSKYHNLNIPLRLMCIGASGSGKTNIITNLLNYMTNTFNYIIIIAKSLDEPLYKHIENRLITKTKQNVVMYEGLDWLNSINIDEHFKDKGQTLIIFDDLMLEPERDQEQIKQLAIRGRKIGGGVSFCYLAQAFHPIPKKIRDQATVLILRKIPNSQDVTAIFKKCCLGISKKQLEHIYEQCVGDSITDFLTIDLNKQPNEMMRKNFNEPII